MERHARGVVLTDAGRRFLQRASSALEEIRRAGEEALQLSGEVTGSVAVALSTAPMLSLAPYGVRQFQRTHRSVFLRITEGSYPIAEQRLLDGHLDFYLGPPPDALPRTFRSDLYFRNERVIVARAGHPLLKARSLRQLTKASWILTGLREREDQEFQELFNAYGIEPPQSRLRVDSTLGLLSILSDSDCITSLPRQWTDAPMFKHLLSPIPVKEKLMAPDIVLITRAGVPLTPAAEQFAEYLRRAVGSPGQ